MSRIERVGKGNAATAHKPAAGIRFDSKSRISDRAILLARQGRYAESGNCDGCEVSRLRPDDVELLIELGAAVWRHAGPRPRRFIAAACPQAQRLGPEQPRGSLSTVSKFA